MQDEARRERENEIQNVEREQKESAHYDHSDVERKEYNEDVEQEIYERDDKLGAI